MKRVNIGEPEFQYDAEDPEGFRSGMFRPREELGPTRTGVSVYEIPPGQSLCPYHYEYSEEEWLLVLAGEATVRVPDGEEKLGPWDLTCFPTGPDGAHEIRNDSADTHPHPDVLQRRDARRDRLPRQRQGRHVDGQPR